MTEQITVLVVEDHKLTRIGVRAAIERDKDIKVIGEAINGKEAIDKFRELKPSVILMDVGMPEMDGIEASQKISKINPKVNIVMLTSHNNEKDVLASLAAGASGYCLKDAEPERLQQAIKSVHSGDAWLDSTIAGIVMRQPILNPKQVAIESQQSQNSLLTSNKDEYKSYVVPLSRRENEVLALIVEGLSNKDIAERLVISLPTAKTHVRNILNKLAVNDRTQAAVHAMREGMFE